jgi:hypothetical protein
MRRKSTRPLPAVTLVGLLIGSSAADAQQPSPSPTELTAIAQAFPETAVVQATDVSLEDCGEVPNPGYVEGDFNGDGRIDFAVLLRGHPTGKVENWQGKQLHETPYVFAIFLSTGDGKFSVTKAERFMDFDQVAAYISLTPAGTVESSINKPIKIHNPGVAMGWCGKSGVVYYLAQGKLKTFWTSD